MSGQRIAEDLRGDVGVGGAARMGKQAGVVGLRCRGRVDPEPVSEPRRGQRALEPMLEREPHAKIGRQTQGPDHLRGADLLGALGRLGCHAPTVSEPGYVELWERDALVPLRDLNGRAPPR